MAEFGALFYDGPSLLTGDRVVGIMTGLEGGSANPKTGPMVQAWIIRPELPPKEAKRQNLDDAICGDCKLRGRDGRDSGCYIAPWLGPYNVWKRYRAGEYAAVSWPELQAVVEGLAVRAAAYGDPAALPFEVWRAIGAAAGALLAYTHAWRRCDPRFKAIAMASVDTIDEYIAAGLLGWRTFRIRMPGEPLVAGGEFVCPASAEAGHRVTCQACRLCRGTSSPARSVAIYPHGKPSSLRVFGLTKVPTEELCAS